MKKLITLLTVCMIVFGSTVTVFADYSWGLFHYVVEEDQIVITEYYGYDAEAVIPEMIAGRTVTKIASGAFLNNNYVTKVVVPATVSVIEPDSIRAGIDVIFANMANNQQESTEPSVSEPTNTPTVEPTVDGYTPAEVAPETKPEKNYVASVAPTLDNNEETVDSFTEEVVIGIDERDVVLDEEDFIKAPVKNDRFLLYSIVAGVIVLLYIIAVILKITIFR